MAEYELEIGIGDVGPIRDISNVYTEERIQDRQELLVSMFTSISDTFTVDFHESTTITIKEEDKGYIKDIEIPNPETEDC